MNLIDGGAFVVLWHELPKASPRPSHWDLMLEAAGALRTWALETQLNAACSAPALQLADHRLEYLEFEGAVSGDRGVVSRWDRGEFRVVAQSAERLIVELGGVRLCGRATLTRDPVDHQRWMVSFEPASERA